MLDTIFAIKFLHLIAAAAMLGTWLCLVVFMLLAHRSQNASVVALTARFVVRVEMIVMIAAMALPVLSGFPLAAAIGLSPLNEFWIDVSLLLELGVVVGWLAALRLELQIRNLAHEAALKAAPLPRRYARLFRTWQIFAGITLAGMTALFALMIWQPRLD